MAWWEACCSVIDIQQGMFQQFLLTLGYVQFQGSWHLGSSQELQSKQSIVFPAEKNRVINVVMVQTILLGLEKNLFL